MEIAEAGRRGRVAARVELLNDERLDVSAVNVTQVGAVADARKMRLEGFSGSAVVGDRRAAAVLRGKVTLEARNEVRNGVR